MPTCNLRTPKTHLHIAIYTKGVRYTTTKVKDFYLNTSIGSYKYMQIALDDIPDNIIKKYNLQEILCNGKVAIKIRKGIYNLPQVVLLSHKHLVNTLDVYDTSAYTSGM